MNDEEYAEMEQLAKDFMVTMYDLFHFIGVMCMEEEISLVSCR